MEEGIREGKFVEYGEYRGNLYGTSLDSVFTIVRSGRVCILNPHPQVPTFFFILELTTLLSNDLLLLRWRDVILICDFFFIYLILSDVMIR